MLHVYEQNDFTDTCIYVCLHIYIYIQIYMYTSIYMNASIYTYMYNLCIYVCLSTCIRVSLLVTSPGSPSMSASQGSSGPGRFHLLPRRSIEDHGHTSHNDLLGGGGL